MGRTKTEDFEALPDPMLQYDFELVLPRIPGLVGFDANSFKTRIMSTSKPGREIEPVMEELHGMTKESAGRVQYSRTLPFEMMERRDGMASEAMCAWSRYCRDDSSQGAYESEYTITGQLIHYDSKGLPIETFQLVKLWLSGFDDAAMDGASSAAVTRTGNLKYYRWFPV